MNEPLDVAHDGAIARLTLNRPASRNALNAEMAEALVAALGELSRDTQVRCVVLSGADGNFCSGGDIKMFASAMAAERAERGQQFEHLAGQVHRSIMALRRLAKLCIASVRGAAAGFGVSLVAACDMAIAAETAYFTLAYTRIGLSPDGGSTYFLPRLIGERRAKELVLLAERFDAATAHEAGLLNRVVPDARLAAETAALAERLAAGPTRAYANAKALLNASWSSTLEAQLEAEAAKLGESAATADFEEEVAAFVAKREPRFSGK